MARTYRDYSRRRDFKPATQEEFNDFPWMQQHYRTYERYLSRCVGDKRNGKWNPPSGFRRDLNRTVRAKQNSAVKNWKAAPVDYVDRLAGKEFYVYSDVDIPRFRRDVLWLWF